MDQPGSDYFCSDDHYAILGFVYTMVTEHPLLWVLFMLIIGIVDLAAFYCMKGLFNGLIYCLKGLLFRLMSLCYEKISIALAKYDLGDDFQPYQQEEGKDQFNGKD